MIEIILDASQIEVFEACPRKWYYSYILNLIPHKGYSPFDIGLYYHSVLKFYYDLYRTKEFDIVQKLQQTIDFAKDQKLFLQYNIDNREDQIFHIQRLITYLNKYEDEDANMEIIATEGGFSQLLFENDERRYILEGKIDLVGSKQPEGLFVMDHKTQSRKDDRWEFNHQVCNYLHFTKANYFIYNYIGLQDKLPAEGLRRCIYKPPEGMIDQWLKEVKLTFDQMYNYITVPIAYNHKDEVFPRRRSACDSSKYGLCQYHKLCSVPDDSIWTEVVKSAYKEKDEKWRAWS